MYSSHLSQRTHRASASPLWRHHARAAQVLGLSLAATGAAHAAGTTVGDMDPADWTRTVISTAGVPSYGAVAPASGGNTGSFWEFTLTSPTVAPGQTAQVREAFLFKDAVYDPGLLGALGSVSIGFDTRTFSSNVGGASVAFGGFATATVQQGGRFYSATQIGAQQIGPGDWASFDFTSFDAGDWLELNTNATPDFSAAGSVLNFGFRISIGGSCPPTSPGSCAGPSTISGLDNFRFELQPDATVTPVPEPGTWALMLAGLGLTGWAARRRRPAQG
jgi:hypothetical protein